VVPGAKPARIRFRLDNVWGAPVGSLDIPGEGDGKNFTTLTANLKLTRGVHLLYLDIVAFDNESFRVDWNEFNKKNNSQLIHHKCISQAICKVN
jgi:hypothetical protein